MNIQNAPKNHTEQLLSGASSSINQINTPSKSQNTASLEFSAPANNQAFNTQNSAPSAFPSVLSELQKAITSLIQGFNGNSTTAPNTTEATPTQPESNYADSLLKFNAADMRTQVTGLSTPATINLNDNPMTAAQLEARMQRAADNGEVLRIVGRMVIDEPITIRPSTSFEIDARGATFVAASGIDDDLISITALPNTQDDPVNVKWTGGTFDISEMQNASSASPHINEFTGGTTNPGPNATDSQTRARREFLALSPQEQQNQRDRLARRGEAATTDGLSIRGVSGNSIEQGIQSAQIDGIRVVGLPVDDLNVPFDQLTLSDPNRTAWYDAGGDSGLFVQGLSDLDITNSEFFGTRDAGIYVTASNPTPEDPEDDDSPLIQFGQNFYIADNVVSNSFDGISSKRGADNVQIKDNTLSDVVVGVSIKETVPNTLGRFIEIDNNEIRRTSRGILVEDAEVVSITNNLIAELGNAVAGELEPRNSSFSNFYEAIALEGVRPGESGLTAPARTARNANGEVTFDSRGNVRTESVTPTHQVANNNIIATANEARLDQISDINNRDSNSGNNIRLVGVSQSDFTPNSGTERTDEPISSTLIATGSGNQFTGITDNNRAITP